jgi:hypothetical protein
MMIRWQGSRMRTPTTLTWPPALVLGNAAILVVDCRSAVTFPHYSAEKLPRSGKQPRELGKRCPVNAQMTVSSVNTKQTLGYAMAG